MFLGFMAAEYAMLELLHPLDVRGYKKMFFRLIAAAYAT